MKNAMFKFSAALTLAAAATSAAYAGGFMLTEQSVAGLGRAYAGSGIVGDDLRRLVQPGRYGSSAWHAVSDGFRDGLSRSRC